MTAAQNRALDGLLPRYGAPEGVLDLRQLFGREARRTLEIGFGDGETLMELAHLHPGEDYLGIEVHRPGVGRLLMALESEGLENVRVLNADAVQVLETRLPDGSLDALLTYFPDPWPKKRHHKRRLVQPEFTALAARKLKPGGRWHLATDWEDYALHMLTVLSAAPGFTNLSPTGDWVPRPPERPATKFERRGLKLGHRVRDLLFMRQ
ncbi:MAG TPA: tRNA (guanosine(46)-N7)-methyltransferase TrmB [Gammaproteobacteria bacterium]|nr:tRNA (guanosine(46)-N7)-methyltransferase TrmB [Gammaproteobacteria bacterium]